jgi:hypothetical protein
MNARGTMAGFGGKRRQREVADIPEPKREDRSLDKLLAVRKQRLDRLERERREAREAWRELRRELREQKEGWRAAVQAYKDFWDQSRKDFFSMSLTSGQFRKAKAIYERMKKEAAQMHADCIEIVQRCKEGADAFFEARRCVVRANKQQEKLGILRDEIRRANRPPEM